MNTSKQSIFIANINNLCTRQMKFCNTTCLEEKLWDMYSNDK